MAIEESTTTKLNLMNDVTVNGKSYQAGQNVEVPKAQADDIARIDYDNQKYQNNLVKSQKFVGSRPGADPRV
jgi:uncharacterized protein (DUF1684 family)